MSDQQVKKAKANASDFLSLMETNGRAKETVGSLLDAIYILEQEVRRHRNTSDKSGEVRILQNKLSVTKTELNQMVKFKEQFVSIISDKIKLIFAHAYEIHNSSDEERVKELADEIINEVKDLVEKVAERRNKAA